ncbi:MAG: calcium/sodium antiporter [Gemmatimonadota bacterium]|nr:calcium/sodium antiporter [Gemmatimonadota bacterium]
MTALLFLAGLAFLLVGAEALVRGASRLAGAAGISPLVVGLTVVAFGTSSPELAVSLASALAGRTDVAMGNVVGSNVFNVLLVLGLSASIGALVVQRTLVRFEVPLLIVVSTAVLLMALDGSVGRVDGAILFAGLIGYTGFAIWRSRRESSAVREEYRREFGESSRPATRRLVLDVLLSAIGLTLLVIGSRWLVSAATTTAEAMGVSSLVVGLTVVAAGTSLPEVATSVLAAVRGERDIAIGNVIGSNLFNLMAVLGLSGILAPDGLAVDPALVRFDLPVMLAAAVACLPILASGARIDRWEGALFLAYYGAWTAYLLLRATAHDTLPAFSAAMLAFVLPLTAVTLAIVAWRSWRDRGGSG